MRWPSWSGSESQALSLMCRGVPAGATPVSPGKRGGIGEGGCLPPFRRSAFMRHQLCRGAGCEGGRRAMTNYPVHSPAELQTACARVQAGDIILVYAGRYAAPSTLTEKRGSLD